MPYFVPEQTYWELHAAEYLSSTYILDMDNSSPLGHAKQDTHFADITNTCVCLMDV
jgi:hypothetical protein